MLLREPPCSLNSSGSYTDDQTADYTWDKSGQEFYDESYDLTGPTFTQESSNEAQDTTGDYRSSGSRSYTSQNGTATETRSERTQTSEHDDWHLTLLGDPEGWRSTSDSSHNESYQQQWSVTNTGTDGQTTTVGNNAPPTTDSSSTSTTRTTGTPPTAAPPPPTYTGPSAINFGNLVDAILGQAATAYNQPANLVVATDAAIASFMALDADANGQNGGASYQAVTAEPSGTQSQQTSAVRYSSHGFWKTKSGGELQKLIEQAIVFLREKIDRLLKNPDRKDADMLKFIRDNLDKIEIVVDGNVGGEQANPEIIAPGGKLVKVTITLHVFNLFNAKDSQGKPWAPGPDVFINLPLPGHMGMDEATMNRLDPQIDEEMLKNNLLTLNGKPAPKTEMWDEKQIAALIANELLHAMQSVGKYDYGKNSDGPAEDVPGMYGSGGTPPWDFHRSLPKNRKFKERSPQGIMHDIYH